MHIVTIRVGAKVDFAAEPSEVAERLKDAYGVYVTEAEVTTLINDVMERSGINEFLAGVGKKIEAEYVEILKRRLQEEGVDIDFPLDEEPGYQQ